MKVVSSDPVQQALYVKVRKNLRRQARAEGKPSSDISDHRFAEMLALRQPPKSLTDREFYEGHGTLDKQFGGDTESLERVVKAAKRQGYNPGVHDVYVPTIAKCEGDPRAFIHGGRGQVSSLLKSRGEEGRGIVKTKSRPRKDPLKNVKLAAPVVAELARPEAMKNGGKISMERVKEISRKHTYKVG